MDQNRYQRQLQLPGFGDEGQQKLAQAKVLVIGAGGLGVPVLQYLAAMGVGNLGIVDADQVSLSNLHRQVIYTNADVGRLKVDVCAERLGIQNPEIQLNTYPIFLSANNALDILKDYHVVVDATDNFNARYLINDACVILNKPFVYGALQQFEGHISVFNYQDGPTYRCLYPDPPSEGQIPDCNTAGVLGIVPGLIGSYQALETVKVLTGIGKSLSGILQVFDFLDNSQYQIKLTAKPENKEIQEIRLPETSALCAADESISAEELLNWMKGKKAFQLIDVREVHEYQSGHLKASFSLPLSRLNGALPDLTGNQPWVILCQQGGRSKKAIQYLKEKQPQLSLLNLDGGLAAWIDSNGMQLIVQP
jgi:molybdopterin/thiamine biosynthesis adenylyltransferase/rhodanese-related sulfurtransferase